MSYFDKTVVSDGIDTLAVNADGSINVVGTLNTGDVEIGAVEIKNGSDDTRATVTASNELKVLASAQPGTDIGDVTINNASGASAVNVQDGGNSLTVDGSVTANAGTNLNTSALALDATLTNKTQFVKLTDGTDTALVTTAGEQNVIATAQPGVDIGDVTINNSTGASAVNIQDGGNSITVDGTVAVSGTVAVTQSGTWDEVGINDSGNSITVDGTVTTNAGNANILIDTNNTTTATLTASSTFTGTATDILAYAQLLVQIYGRPGVVAGDGSSAVASFYFEFSKDGTNWDTSVPHLIRDPSLVIPIPIIFAHRYFRVKYVNDGGAAAISALGLADTVGTPTNQTTFRLTTYLFPEATKELTRTLDQSISGSDPVNVVRAVIMGKLPNGNYNNIPGRGRSASNNTSATLTANSVYTGTFEPVTGYVSLSVIVAADQASAAEGIEIQHSDDGTNVRYSDKFAFTTTDVTNGYASYICPARSDYGRVKYTNGGTNQGTFHMTTYLSPTVLENIETTVEAPISSSNTSEIGRSFVLAKNDSGSYGNVTRGTSSGLRVSVNQHEVSTPILALTTASRGQTSVLTSATQIDTSQLSSRKCIVVKALNSNTKKVYVGFTSGVTTGNGYELDSGQFVEMDLDTTSQIWAISDTSTQTVAWIQVA